ncbi:MAG: RNA-binding cell elongation regulator Jag/EloR [Acidimicrobiales bacterium]
MEWVEMTGRTVQDAKESALDELGVDEQDAEFEVMEEPKLGLFGRLRTEARVRARVRPTTPRAKEDRRDRRRRGRVADSDTPEAAPLPEDVPIQTGRSYEVEAVPECSSAPQVAPPNPAPAPDSQRPTGRDPQRGTRHASSRDAVGPARSDHPHEEVETSVDVALEEQAAVAQEFLAGLAREFDLEAEIRVDRPDEDTIDLRLEGANLGLLIGPKGMTLLAIQDLTRTVVQRRTGGTNGRIHVDIGGYRHKRAVALGRFARQVAEQVRVTGTPKALEAMPAPDRKVVHDALADIDGVSTSSEGEGAERRVVISPSSD